MRDWLIACWNLRRSADRRARWAWYAVALVATLAVLDLPWPRALALGCVAVYGACLAGRACAWGAFHPRRVLAGRQAVWRWAGWLTMIAVVGAYAGALQAATSLLVAALPTAGLLSALLIGSPFVFALLFAYGCMGAAVSAFAVRNSPDRDRLTRAGVNVWWLLTLFDLLAVATAARMSDSAPNSPVLPVAASFFTVPLFTVLLCAYARNPEHEPRRIAERLLQRLSRYLTFRRRLNGRTLTLDLRGAAVGLLVAASVFGLLRPFLKAPSASLLIWMMQVRNQEAQGAWTRTELDDPSSVFGDRLARRDDAILAQRRNIVLIDLDTPVLRAAFAPSKSLLACPSTRIWSGEEAHSEAALDSLLIQSLHRLGAAVVVLMPPQPQPPPASKDQGDVSPALIAKAEPAPSLHDDPQLAAAVKEAGNVVLALPISMQSLFYNDRAPRSPEPTVPAALRGAALGTGGEDLFSYGSVRLPVLQSNGPHAAPPLPIVVAELYALALHSGANYSARGPFVTPVDFRSAKPDHDFLHVPASVLLHPTQRDAPGADLILSPDGQWKPLGSSIKGRIVFLDTLIPHRRETPLGVLSTREVLAYATATVLAREKGLRVATKRSLLLTLLVGAFMGTLCARRTPIEAVRRMLGMSVLMVVASLACYMRWTLWLDAVVPMAAIVLTYLLVTQLSFTQQQERNRDLLKRFVAPQFVDAMLAQPADHLGLGGKLSHICVLFADVRNFTGFAERHTPEQVFAAVNQYMTALTNALHAYGGILDKYTGDGLMAWFPGEEDSHKQIENAVKVLSG